MDTRLKNLLIVDIETVPNYSSFDKMPEEMKKHWVKKTQYLSNLEEKSAEEMYNEKAGVYSEFGKIIVIGFGAFFKNNEKICLKIDTYADEDEKNILTKFITLLKKFNQKTLRYCTHNGKEFDLPYLCRRMVVNEIPLPYSLDLSDKKPWEIPHIDTLDLWKFGDRKNFTSLGLLTDLLGIPSSKNEMDGSQVATVFYHEQDGLQKISKYCKGDIVATAQLYLRLKGFSLLEKQNIYFS